MRLLEFSERGIYCQKAGIFIDPWQPVPRALITHAHSDHARAGNGHYLATSATIDQLEYRLGTGNKYQAIEFGETVTIQGVQFSFHPAGHLPGSAQIRIEDRGEVWVVSGDYKTVADGISEQFEAIPCDVFVTESTFGLPVYQWPGQESVYQEMNQWWEENKMSGVTSVIGAYSLGKAQRIIRNLDHSIGPIYCHGAVQSMNTVVRASGYSLPDTLQLDDAVSAQALKEAIVIAPGSALATSWMKRFREVSTAAASGWMTLRGRKRWQNLDRGFVLSDHADWNELNAAIHATGCHEVIVTHGYSEVFSAWLRGQGYQSQAEKTSYEGETETL